MIPKTFRLGCRSSYSNGNQAYQCCMQTRRMQHMLPAACCSGCDRHNRQYQSVHKLTLLAHSKQAQTIGDDHDACVCADGICHPHDEHKHSLMPTKLRPLCGPRQYQMTCCIQNQHSQKFCSGYLLTPLMSPNDRTYSWIDREQTCQA